jgi:hypothetical protein
MSEVVGNMMLVIIALKSSIRVRKEKGINKQILIHLVWLKQLKVLLNEKGQVRKSGTFNP